MSDDNDMPLIGSTSRSNRRPLRQQLRHPRYPVLHASTFSGNQDKIQYFIRIGAADSGGYRQRPF